MTDPAEWTRALEADRPVLVTGAAGFIRFHLAERLLRARIPVVGIDTLNDYYDPALKRARLDIMCQHPGFAFEPVDITDRAALDRLFDAHGFRHVVNLAAQAGVRHSLQHPHAYAEANVTGFLTLLEACRHAGVAHIVYASSSSIYGGNTRRRPLWGRSGVLRKGGFLAHRNARGSEDETCVDAPGDARLFLNGSDL